MRASRDTMTIEHYYYGLAALMYLTTCWMFAAVRWWHTCKQPKRTHRYIWPDRKLQCLLYMCASVLLPYIINPTSPSAWLLQKVYFPATYYFYCGVLLLCFAGTVKQWNQWKGLSWVAAIMVIGTMLVPMLNAWLPTGILNANGLRIWQYVVLAESTVMVGYVALAMWQVKHWMDEARDANYSNPDDFPDDYASRRFTSFAHYVNSLRLAHFDQYVADHPEETKESAALASGYSSYNSYYRSKQKMERQ